MTTESPTFATVLNCIDGRVQVPVNEAVRSLFSASYVDTITAPGIVKLLSDSTHLPETRGVLSSTQVSLEKHGSRAIAITAHHDCAGNPVDDAVQREQLERAVAYLAKRFRKCRVVGLWLAQDWSATVVCEASASS